MPVSISAGVGVVPQAVKFGRDISGNQYALYTLVHDGDFVYNKGNSLKFPQGCVYQLRGWGAVAAPNVYITFRLKEGFVAEYFQFCFEKNIHGIQLKKHITSGARSNGLLNVSKEQFFTISIPAPAQDEQQKIADCLTSLDEVIAAQGRKVEILKVYRRGLMQQFLPRDGETLPRLRFPEFHDASEWKEAQLGDLFDTTSGGTPDRVKNEYWDGSIPWVTTSLVDFNLITKTDEFISEAGLANSSAKILPKGTVLVAMYGQGKTRGKVAMLGMPAATNQACAAILPHDEIDQRFTFVSLCGRYEEMRAVSNAGGQENLSQGLIRELLFKYPKDSEEQSTIVECLLVLDALISSEKRRLDSLGAHKKGLMQQLLPSLEDIL